MIVGSNFEQQIEPIVSPVKAQSCGFCNTTQKGEMV